MSAGSYQLISLRDAAILTNSYVAATTIGNSYKGDEYNQLNLMVSFTKGSLTSAEIKVEFSNDLSTWFQETFASISSGTETDTLGEHTFTATGNYLIEKPFKYRYVKVSAKGTGTVTSSSLAITAMLADV